MSSSDTYGVNGDRQSGHPLQVEHTVERPFRQSSNMAGVHLVDETYLSPVSPSSATTSEKWALPFTEAFHPEPQTANVTTASQTNQKFPASPYQSSASQLFGAVPSQPKPVDARFGMGIVVAESVSESPVTAAFSELRRRIQIFLGDQISPIRLASHLAVIAVAGVVLIVSQVELPDWQFSLRNLPRDGIFTISSNQASPAGNTDTLNNNASEAAEAFQRAVIPFTNPQEQPILSSVQEVAAPVQASTSGLIAAREQIETYSVRSGDTVLGIAAQFNLQPETIQWANPELEANPDMLRIGDRLVILPVDGVLHVVQPGDTLSTMAAKYKVTTEAITGFGLNQIPDITAQIPVGQQLVIPGGNKPYIAKQVMAYSGPVPEGAIQGSGNFSWPTSGSITQPYWNGHRAIDVGAWTGTAVTASDSGYVIASSTGWNNGYGTMVMIDHGGGYVTLYGHLNSIFVRQGESVAKGQQLGTVGNTGNSTGSHLHFEVRYQGVPRNPFNFLP
jgi:murein DD-endopeptidase MepM/ murein hydrolase activator NlpD